MNVSLTPELERLVNQKVATGLYNSASEVIRAGLRLLDEQDQLKQAQLDSLRREVDVGAEQIRSGLGRKYKNGSELAERIKQRGRKRIER